MARCTAKSAAKSHKLRITWPDSEEETEVFEFHRFPYAGVPVGRQVLVDFNLCNDKWALEIYPGGEKHEDADNISIFVRYNGEKEVVNAVFSMNLIDATAEKNIPVFDGVAVTYDSEHKRWGRKKAVSRKEVQGRSFSGNFTLQLFLRIIFSGPSPPDPNIERVVPDARECSPNSSLESACTAPTLHSDMKKLLESGMGTDVTFVVGKAGVRVPAHRLIVSLRCPIPILHESMAEGRSDAEVRVEDIEPEPFKAMLRFLYTDTCGEEALATLADHILAAADKYGLERLQVLCEDRLLRGMTADNVCDMLALANTRGRALLQESCIAFICAHAQEVMATEGFGRLTRDFPSLVVDLFAAAAGVSPPPPPPPGDPLVLVDG